MHDAEGAPTLRSHFSLDFNLGHLAIVISMLGSAAVIYADLKSTIATHEYRLGSIERNADAASAERIEAMREIRSSLKEINKAIAEVQRAVDGKQDRPR